MNRDGRGCIRRGNGLVISAWLDRDISPPRPSWALKVWLPTRHVFTGASWPWKNLEAPTICLSLHEAFDILAVTFGRFSWSFGRPKLMTIGAYTWTLSCTRKSEALQNTSIDEHALTLDRYIVRLSLQEEAETWKVQIIASLGRTPAKTRYSCQHQRLPIWS